LSITTTFTSSQLLSHVWLLTVVFGAEHCRPQESRSSARSGRKDTLLYVHCNRCLCHSSVGLCLIRCVKIKNEKLRQEC